mgnify:CR=1 FL=1
MNALLFYLFLCCQTGMKLSTEGGKDININTRTARQLLEVLANAYYI